MAGRKSAKKGARKAARSAQATSRKLEGFTAEEKAAMREYIQERKAGASASKGDAERAVLAKIAAMQGTDRVLGKRLHEIIMAAAPELAPRTWYGMPAYTIDGKVICFFQNAQKFKSRYSTLGFSDKANLDEGAMWPTGFALKELTGAVEARIIALVKKAVS